MENLLEDIEQYVTSYLNDHLDTSFVYHNLAHTQRVVSKAKELIEEWISCKRFIEEELDEKHIDNRTEVRFTTC